MNNCLITCPDKPLTGEIQLPASKSISNRVLMLNALAYSPYNVENLADCDDTNVMLQALSSNDRNFNIGAAGTAMRFLTAFLAKIVGEWTITGTERMQNRPIRLLVDALNSLGARIEYIDKEGYPPLRIFGSSLHGGEISLAGNVSSQYISALLMVAPLMENGLTLHLEGTIISKPYIRLTIALMKQYGVEVLWHDNVIRILPQSYIPIRFSVESDWSAASYWYEMMALAKEGSRILLKGLSKNSLQGDAVCAKLFQQLGVSTNFTAEGAVLKKSKLQVSKLRHDFVSEPDLAQTFAVTCLALNCPFRFSGLQSLRIKETDRIAALQTEAVKLGFVLNVVGDKVIEWYGERCDSAANPVIDTYEDHRMAMAFAPLSFVCKGGLSIANPQVVSKSYPTYWETLCQQGFGVVFSD